MRLNDSEISVVQQVYKKVQYNKKFNYMTGNPKFAMRKLNFKVQCLRGANTALLVSIVDSLLRWQEPEQNVENVIVGKCQSGKSGEAAWTAWCTWFVLGCLPVILVRNSGGKSQGIDDMRRAIHKMNDVIRVHLSELGVPADQHDKYLLTNFLMEEDQIPLRNRGFGHTGSVLVVLNNPTHLRRLASHIPRRRASSQAEGDGLSVAMRLDQYSRKDGRTRMVLIIDEADLVVGSPGRKGNASERWHFEERMRMRSGEMARGLRELVFGTVSITATPCALFLCSITTIMCPYCDKFFGEGEGCVRVRHWFDSEEGERQMEHCHLAHVACIQLEVEASRGSGHALLCRKCSGTRPLRPNGGRNSDTESEEEQGESSSSSSLSDAASDAEEGAPVRAERMEAALTRSVELDPAYFENASSSGRKMKPHVVQADTPDNYVRYATSFEDEREAGPWTIVRMRTPERVGKLSKTQVRGCCQEEKQRFRVQGSGFRVLCWGFCFWRQGEEDKWMLPLF